MNPFHTAPFRQYGAAVIVAGSTTSAGTTLTRAADQTAIVSNPTAAVAYVKFGAGAQTATNADNAVLAGQKRVFSLLAAETHVAVLLSTGTGDVHIAVGDGTTT